METLAALFGGAAFGSFAGRRPGFVDLSVSAFVGVVVGVSGWCHSVAPGGSARAERLFAKGGLRPCGTHARKGSAGPFGAVNPDIQGIDSETGLGDVLIRGAVRAARGKGYAVVAGTELIFDTATEETLGTGKYQLAPLVFASIDVPFLRSTLYPFYQHYFSFAGDGSRLDIHYNSFRPSVIVTKWGHRWYTALDPNFYVDLEQGPDAGMTLELEAGRGLNKNFSVWARPGIGAFGDIHQVYDWSVEVGMRYLFQ